MKFSTLLLYHCIIKLSPFVELDTACELHVCISVNCVRGENSEEIYSRVPNVVMLYDTIRDAILTCAQKPTRVGLIYRTETTTKNCKTEKLKKIKADMLEVTVKVWGIM